MRYQFTGLTCLLTALAFGCADTSMPTGNDSSLSKQTLTKTDAKRILEQKMPWKTIDDEFSEFSQRIPGFGGMFLNQDGKLVVHITASGLAQISEDELIAVLSETRYFGDFFDQELAADDLIITEGQFDFGQLSQWRDLILNQVSSSNIMFLDVDERLNRVAVGVEELAAIGGLESNLNILGVPEEAVIFEESGSFKLNTELDERFRPMRGGLEIGLIYGGFCTKTVPVRLASATNGVGFLTNSHCTNGRGGVEGTRYTQDKDDAEIIGEELYDPQFFTGSPCPSEYQCRYSDSAFIEYEADQYYSLDYGGIARTTWRGQYYGSTTISNNHFTVNDHAAAGVGSEVNAIGSYNGWTYGTVQKSCSHENITTTPGIGGTNTYLLCQYTADYVTGDGDSGAPVFTWQGGNMVDLVGIHWGVNTKWS